jgi:hypothetical protein
MSYDHRTTKITTKIANMDLSEKFFSAMQKVREQTRKMEARAVNEILKDVKYMIVNLGLDLDIKASWVQQYRVGSDSWGYSAAFVLKDLLDRGDALDAETVSMSVWDVTRMDPKKVTKKSPGVWIAEMEWGG